MSFTVVVTSQLTGVSSETLEVSADQTINTVIAAFCARTQINDSCDLVMRDRTQAILDGSRTLQDCGITAGDTLYISTKELSERGLCCCALCNQWLVLAAVLLVIAAAGLVTISLMKVRSSKHPQDYGVVLDAGSSHTQVYVYRWDAEKDNGTGNVQQVFTQRQSGGIAHYNSTPEQAGPSLRPLLDSAVKHVPVHKRHLAPVWLGATAGMRLLDAANKNASDAIFYSVRTTLSDYPFLFNNSACQARILDGSDEGTFGWVTVNYVSDAFVEQTSSVWSYLVAASHTHGALDLGGASTQITFIPQQPVQANYSESVYLYGEEYTVYSHSYLCYGQDEAHRNLSALLVLDALAVNSSVRVIENPCQPRGNETSMHFKDIFEAPCTVGHSPNISDTNTTFTFVGTSNSTECRVATLRVFNLTCTEPPCGFNGVYQPTVHGQFYAFSGFWNTMHFLNATQSALSEFEQITDDFCSKDWAQISVIGAAPEYLVEYCFLAHYIHSLLIEGYKFNATTWTDIIFTDKVADQDLGWTLGYMLNATNRYPALGPTIFISTTMFALLLVLFVLMLGISAAFVLHGVQRRKSSQYSPLTENSNI